MNETRERPGRSLPSRTEKTRTELGNLYLAVTSDDDDRPFEAFLFIDVDSNATNSLGSMTRENPGREAEAERVERKHEELEAIRARDVQLRRIADRIDHAPELVEVFDSVGLGTIDGGVYRLAFASKPRTSGQ